MKIKFPALILIIMSLFLNTVSGQDEQRLSAAWQVTKYNIAATLPQNPADRNLSAKATVSLKNVGRGAGATVTFRINQKAEIISAKIGASDAGFRKTVDDKLGNLQRFTVTLPGSIQPDGAATVTIDYRIPVAENSGLIAISSVGSQFLPLSNWFPTPNNPYSPRGADYAPFNLNVSGASGETVVSSGKASSTGYEQGLNAQPFFVTGSWDLIESGNGISVYLPKGFGAEERKRAEDLAALTAAARDYIKGTLGDTSTIPFRLVAVRRGAGFADGGTILLDASVFRRPKIDAQVAMTIVESISKVLLGNLTAIRGEGHGAVREGLAQFVATKFIEKQFGKDSANIEQLRQRTAYASIAKRDAPLSLTSQLDETYFASTSNKGAMVWRLVAKIIGEDKFFTLLRSQLQSSRNDGLSLPILRQKLIEQADNLKPVLDFGFDKLTDTDLLIGLPQSKGSETSVALRNQGSLPVSVNVVALTDKGERLSAAANIAEKNFGEALFKTPAKIVRVEIDPEKLYPQIDYSNDIAPREFTENDLLAEIIRAFNRQEFSKAESAARKILQNFRHLDEARTWLGRSLVEQNKLEEAEREFNAALNEKLPTAKTLAWANIGLGEIALRRNQNAQAAIFFNNAVKADAEYGSNLAARNGRIKAENAPSIDEAAKSFFANFDKAILSRQKAQVDNLLLSGELKRFSNGITGNQPEQWETRILRTEFLDANHLAVDAGLTAKIINREQQIGTALFILARSGNGWKLAQVDLFEVR